MHLQIPLWFEIGTYVALALILTADVVIAYRRPHVPSTRESALWITFYVVLALVFAGLMLVLGDAEHAGQFVAGWLTEYSLSIDNLFVFLIIMSRFSVPRKYQQEILMVGIILALVFRGIFILLGSALIENFSWIFYLFGLFLLYTAVNQAFTNHDDEEANENRLIRMMRRRISITEGLNKIPGVKARLPDGAFYSFADCSALIGKSYKGTKIDGSMKLSEILLDEFLVAAVPGAPFGAEGFIRLSFATSDANIEKGLARLADCVSQLS